MITLSKREKDLLEEARADLGALESDDWLMLRVWFVEATESARGCKLWPRTREEFLGNLGEAMEKIRRWWNEDGGADWWASQEQRRKRRVARVTEVPAEGGESMSGEEAVAFLREGRDS